MRFAIGAFDAVDPNINHSCPGFDPIWSHQPRGPGRRNHNVTRAGQLGQIFGEPVGTEHGGFRSHQQQRNRFSHDVGLANHEAPHATQIHAAAFQHVANRESGTRHQRTPAKDSVADVGRIDPLDIFVRINGRLDAFRFHPLRQGQKHHHGVDLGIGIETLDAGEDRGFVRILGDGVQMEPNPQLLGPGPLPLGIDFGACITLGQDGVQANLAAFSGQRDDAIPQNPAFFGRQSPSINHVGHSTSHGRKEDYSRTRYCVPMSTNRDLLLVSVGNTSITAAPAPGNTTASRQAGNSARLSSRRRAPLAAFASRSTVAAGLLTVVFLAVHLGQLRWPRPPSGAEAAVLSALLHQPINAILYGLAALALGLHLLHGAEAAHRSMGWLTPANSLALRRGGRLLAGLIGGGFLLISLCLALGGGA